ncbi:MAG: hypothetical protein HY401_05105 [Elusimicrobia bacterium]|nr:hypothetical protein [Elusimicrobiota bacterium]
MAPLKLSILLAVLVAGIPSLQAETKIGLKQAQALGANFATGGKTAAGQKVRNLTTKFELRENGRSVEATISIDPQQLTSIDRRGGYVEVRFYAGPSGQERRLAANRTFELRRDGERFLLPYSEICEQSGRVSVRVWTTVRGTDRSYTDGEARGEFPCRASDSGGGYNPPSGGNTLHTRVTPREGFWTGNVYADVAVDPSQFRNVLNRYGYVEIRLYAGRQRGQEKRLGNESINFKDQTYKLTRFTGNSDRVTFDSSDVCDSSDRIFYNRYLKVWVSAREADGTPFPGFRPAEGVRITVRCNAFTWNGISAVEDW